MFYLYSKTYKKPPGIGVPNGPNPDWRRESSEENIKHQTYCIIFGDGLQEEQLFPCGRYFCTKKKVIY